MNDEKKECCPEFHPERWDQKNYAWHDKPFIKESMPTLFHIPFPKLMEKKIIRLCQQAENSKMTEADSEDALLLFHDPSAFKSEIFLSVTGVVPNADNTVISGAFVAKVFSGPYNAVPKFMKQMNEYLAAQGKEAKDYYIHYAYCPKCAKKFGNNYMIIFAQV